MASRARSLGGHGGSGASGGHGGSGDSDGHGGSGDSHGHGGSGIWPPKKIFLGGSPAGGYTVRASGDEGELDGTSGDEGELGGASVDEGKLDETNFRGRSGSTNSRGALTLGDAREALNWMESVEAKVSWTGPAETT